MMSLKKMFSITRMLITKMLVLVAHVDNVSQCDEGKQLRRKAKKGLKGNSDLTQVQELYTEATLPIHPSYSRTELRSVEKGHFDPHRMRIGTIDPQVNMEVYQPVCCGECSSREPASNRALRTFTTASIRGAHLQL